MFWHVGWEGESGNKGVALFAPWLVAVLFNAKPRRRALLLTVIGGVPDSGSLWVTPL